jgi:aladin
VATLKEIKADTNANNVLKDIAKYLLILAGARNQPRLSLESTKSHIIRFICWHPNFFRVAVASSDNIVRIYNDENQNFAVLKNGIQKGISCLSWRPWSASELAVGCENGVLIWTVDTSSRALAQVHCLDTKNHLNITSLAWSVNGDLLATASANDSDIWLWDVDQNRHVGLKRVGPACTQLSWSPNGGKLWSSTATDVFRVWSTTDWRPERWSIKQCGHIKSAAWSQCGNFLLFVVSKDSYLYSLGFVQEQLFSKQSAPSVALPVVDLTRTQIGQLEIGGQPEQLAWCAHSKQLAVTFGDTAAIVLFNTVINKYALSVTPLCFFTGIGAEVPSFVCFKPDYHQRRSQANTVLTIGWSSGRVQYFPFN